MTTHIVALDGAEVRIQHLEQQVWIAVMRPTTDVGCNGRVETYVDGEWVPVPEGVRSPASLVVTLPTA